MIAEFCLEHIAATYSVVALTMLALAGYAFWTIEENDHE